MAAAEHLEVALDQSLAERSARELSFALSANRFVSMSEPYFVRDYRSAVAKFIATNPLDRAMARSVGGGDGNPADFEAAGKSELSILTEAGFSAGHALIDVGCGSGRLTSQVGHSFGETVSYLGIDVVPELLAYAKARAPSAYGFQLVIDCLIPARDESADFVACFSVFTHLRRREIAQYMGEARRVLRPTGKLIFSYLELPRHAKTFVYTLALTLVGRRKVENHFASERSVRRWAAESDFRIEAIMPGRIYQSVAILQKI
jgi:ubiquinone/menaquinone biosynthesis C-methylase UbiE